jgi:transcriptional regulator with XRE-family HTH domain
MTDTSALIRTARLALGLTQQQLGEHLGYAGENAQRYVYGWEAGRRKVPRDKVQKLAELLQLDPIQLL